MIKSAPVEVRDAHQRATSTVTGAAFTNSAPDRSTRSNDLIDHHRIDGEWADMSV
jgi:hypothetical protein